MNRGEIWWASLPDPAGSGPGYRRPVLVVQANSFNDSKLATTLVAVITSNLKLAMAPGNVRIGKGQSGLGKPSVVNVSQVMTIDRRMLTSRVKVLPAMAVSKVADGLRLVVGLG